MHLSKENYSEEEIKLLIDRLCGSLSIDPENFLRDIKLYKNFEKIRVSFDKMNKACELLRKGYSVADTSALVGYNDSFNFSKMFSKRIGISPREYKNSK